MILAVLAGLLVCYGPARSQGPVQGTTTGGTVGMIKPDMVDDIQVDSISDFTGGDPPPSAVIQGEPWVTAAPGMAYVYWETGFELYLLGFNVYRSDTVDGTIVKLNDTLIPPEAIGGVGGAQYDFADPSVDAGGVYYYWVEVVVIGAADTTEPLYIKVPFYALYIPVIGQ